jgi:hypothetical protein
VYPHSALGVVRQNEQHENAQQRDRHSDARETRGHSSHISKNLAAESRGLSLHDKE